MGVQRVYTDDLVELYSMAKIYAKDNGPINIRQEEAIIAAEQMIENNSGYQVEQKYDS